MFVRKNQVILNYYYSLKTEFNIYLMVHKPGKLNPFYNLWSQFYCPIFHKSTKGQYSNWKKNSVIIATL